MVTSVLPLSPIEKQASVRTHDLYGDKCPTIEPHRVTGQCYNSVPLKYPTIRTRISAVKDDLNECPWLYHCMCVFIITLNEDYLLGYMINNDNDNDNDNDYFIRP